MVGNRVVGSNLRHYATRERRLAYVQQRNFSPAQAWWISLSDTLKTEWASLAEVTPLYDKNKAAVPVEASQFAITYNTNLVYFGQSSSFQDTPPSQPSWGERPQFSEFAALAAGPSWQLTCEVALDSGTVIAAYGQPPVQGDTPLNRAAQRYLGTVAYPSGLAVGETDIALGQLYIDYFGSNVVDPSYYTWLQLFQIEGGYMRILKDPCRPKEPPIPPGVVRVTVRNGYSHGTVTSPAPAEYQLGDEFSLHNFYGVQFGPLAPSETYTVDVPVDYPPGNTTVGQTFGEWSDGGSVNAFTGPQAPSNRITLEFHE